MRLIARTKQAKRHLERHTIAVICADKTQYYALCIDDDCGHYRDATWSRWFTEDEVEAVCDHDVRCCIPHGHHLQTHYNCTMGE